MKYHSNLIEKAVDSFSSLPGIGRKSGLRLALFLLSKDKEWVTKFSESFTQLKNDLKECKVCHNYSDQAICNICEDTLRSEETICVVESVRDLMAIEETGQYKGKFHVLGGLISPIDGVGPEDLHLYDLYDRIKTSNVKEVILAISPNIEGETTMYYISKKLRDINLEITTISRGISFGGELEYADELTLGRSIVSRVPYHQYSASI